MTESLGKNIFLPFHIIHLLNVWYLKCLWYLWCGGIIIPLHIFADVISQPDPYSICTLLGCPRKWTDQWWSDQWVIMVISPTYKWGILGYKQPVEWKVLGCPGTEVNGSMVIGSVGYNPLIRSPWIRSRWNTYGVTRSTVAWDVLQVPSNIDVNGLFHPYMGVEPKIGGFSLKMDGENNGKP